MKMYGSLFIRCCTGSAGFPLRLGAEFSTVSDFHMVGARASASGGGNSYWIGHQQRAARAGWLIDGLDLQHRGIRPVQGKRLSISGFLCCYESRDESCMPAEASRKGGTERNYPDTSETTSYQVGSRLGHQERRISSADWSRADSQFVTEGDRLKISRILGSRERTGPMKAGSPETADFAS
jgi:hypothetical protein